MSTTATITKIIDCYISGMTVDETLKRFKIIPEIHYEKTHKRYRPAKQIRKVYNAIAAIEKADFNSHWSTNQIYYGIRKTTKISESYIRNIHMKLLESGWKQHKLEAKA